MTPAAVLFDIGGPIDAEREHERLIDDALRAEAGEVSDAAYAAAWAGAVASFAPNAYEAVLFRLLGEHAAQAWPRVLARLPARGPLELRDGVADLLAALRERDIPLGIVANQPRALLEMLESAGIARYFVTVTISGAVGLRKPDPRIFLQACAAMGVAPEACIMVGDRIDNDIAPARALGMATVRYICGRHAEQRPRSWREIPDVEVEDVAGMRAALFRMLQIT